MVVVIEITGEYAFLTAFYLTVIFIAVSAVILKYLRYGRNEIMWWLVARGLLRVSAASGAVAGVIVLLAMGGFLPFSVSPDELMAVGAVLLAVSATGIAVTMKSLPYEAFRTLTSLAIVASGTAFFLMIL